MVSIAASIAIPAEAAATACGRWATRDAVSSRIRTGLRSQRA